MDTPLVIQGDARRIGGLGFEPASVECIITSPPYFNLKRYDQESTVEVGEGQTLEEYFQDLEGIFRSWWELTKDGGVFWLIADSLRNPAVGGGVGELEPLPVRLADSAHAV